MSTSQPMSSAPSSKPDQSKQRLLIIAAVIIGLLLVVNAVLLYFYTKNARENAELTLQVDETEQVKAQLEKEYYEALSELEELRTGNAEMDILIDQQKEELRQQKDRIDALLRDRGNLDRARGEIRQLTQRVEGYVAEINQLREQNQLLSSENAQLSQQRDSLSQNLENERYNTSLLASEREQLASEREQLATRNASLNQRVTQASVVKVAGIQVSGQRTRRSGKAVTRRDAENVEQLEICFATLPNDVAQPGEEQFLVRIVNPQGETLALDNQGSGVFTNVGSGSQMRYTLAKSFNFNQDAGSLCVLWAPGTPFQAGNYEVEIYNKGYLAGLGSFRLN